MAKNSESAVTWYEKNYMKLNTDKCHLIISGTKYEHVWVKLGKDKIWKSNNLKLLGVKMNNELKFDEHIFNICLQANWTFSQDYGDFFPLKNGVLYSKSS